jgi:hypothetical protein
MIVVVVFGIDQQIARRQVDTHPYICTCYGETVITANDDPSIREWDSP